MFDPKNKNYMNSSTMYKDSQKRLWNRIRGKKDLSIYAKKPPHLKGTINLANLDNGFNERIVKDLEKELTQRTRKSRRNTICNDQQPSTTRTQRSNGQKKETCEHCGKEGHHKAQCWKLEKNNKKKQESKQQTLNPKNQDVNSPKKLVTKLRNTGGTLTIRTNPHERNTKKTTMTLPKLLSPESHHMKQKKTSNL